MPHSCPPPHAPHDDATLADCVRASLTRYFRDLGEAEPRELWQMVMACVERPLLETVLARTEHNQTRAAEMLGITRNTLRKKLLAHQLATP